MSSLPPDAEDQTEYGRVPVTPEPPGAPTWAKILGAFALAILIVFLVLLLSGDSKHGPRLHMPHGAGSMLSK